MSIGFDIDRNLEPKPTDARASLWIRFSFNGVEVTRSALSTGDTFQPGTLLHGSKLS